jgi:hypothetical protein
MPLSPEVIEGPHQRTHLPIAHHRDNDGAPIRSACLLRPRRRRALGVAAHASEQARPLPT